MGNPSTMVVLFARVVKSECVQSTGTCWLTDELSRTPFPSKGRHGREGQAAGLQSYTWTLNKHPTNASRVGIDAHSEQTKRRKVEGAHRCSSFFIAMGSLPSYMYS